MDKTFVTRQLLRPAAGRRPRARAAVLPGRVRGRGRGGVRGRGGGGGGGGAAGAGLAAGRHAALPPAPWAQARRPRHLAAGPRPLQEQRPGLWGRRS